MNSSCWPELHASRMEWALRGYQSFVDSIDPELRQDYRRDDQITLVVYGSTQVGKTTLILNLLGIEERKLPIVASLLRGGQTAGKSATATAVRYRKSVDENWYLGAGQSQPLTDEAICTQLGELRRQMEGGHYCDAAVLDIHIPRRYFNQDRESGLEICLIDLPGLNANNAHERAHVTRLANKYVPLADLVILTIKAEQLGELHPNALQLDALKDWAIQPKRFRIVLTHSFSCQSFVDQFDASQTLQSVRDRTYQQCCTHDYPMREEIRQSLYPLEFGDSWSALKQSNPAYFEQVQPIAGELKQELLTSLKGAANPYGRLQMILDLHRVASEKIRQREEKHNQIVDALNAWIDQQREKRDHMQRLAHQLDAELEELAALIAHLDSPGFLKSLNDRLIKHFPPKELYYSSLEEKTESLIDAAEEHLTQLETLWQQAQHGVIAEALEGYDCQIALGAGPQIEELGGFFLHLRGYMLSTYFPALSSDYEDDVARLGRICRAANVLFQQEASSRTQLQLHQWRDKQTHQLKRWREEKLLLEKSARSAKSQLAAATDDLALQERSFFLFQGRMEQAIQQCKDFQRHMQRAHHDETASLQQRYHTEPSPAMRFYLLALQELHRPELDRMMEKITT